MGRKKGWRECRMVIELSEEEEEKGVVRFVETP